MLDKFLDVGYARTKQAEAQDELVELMRQLPEDELHKIASGEVKVGYFPGDDDGKWLDRFKGTPLFQQALEVEKQDLEQRMLDKQRRREQRQVWDDQDAVRDQLCIKRKLLDIQLAEHEGGGGEAAPGEAIPEEAAGPEMAGEQPQVPEAPAAPEAQPVAEAPPEAPPEAAAPEEKAAEARERMKVARTLSLREVERETVRRHAEYGKKKGRRLGAKSGGKGGALTGAAGTAAGGAGLLAAAHKAGLLKGKGKGKVIAALAAAGTAGTAAGAGVGAARGGKKGGRVGERLGRRAGHITNIRRRQAILRALRRHQAGQRTKTSAATLTSREARDHLEHYYERAIDRLAHDEDVSRAGVANLGSQMAEEDAKESNRMAREVKGHPTKYRIRRGLFGGTVGGLGGAGIGHLARGGKGALIGGLIGGGAGAALGAIPKPTGASYKNHAETTREALKTLKPNERKRLAGWLISQRVLSRPYGWDDEPESKTSSADPDALREMQKKSAMGPILAGAKGLLTAGRVGGQRAVKAGKKVMTAGQKGKGEFNIPGAASEAKKQLGVGAKQLGAWGKKYPGRAATAAFGAGYMMG
jgi:hypothetical protein